MWENIKYFFVEERVVFPVGGCLYKDGRYISCVETIYLHPRYKDYIPRISVEVRINHRTWIFYSYPYAPGYCDYDGIYKPSKWFQLLRLHKLNPKKKGYLMNDELMEQTLASRQDRNPEAIKREQRAGDDTVEVPGTQQGVKEQKEEKR